MKIKNLKVRVASFALSLVLTSGAGFTLSSPAYALEDDAALLYEQQLEEEEELKRKKEEEERALAEAMAAANSISQEENVTNEITEEVVEEEIVEEINSNEEEDLDELENNVLDEENKEEFEEDKEEVQILKVSGDNQEENESQDDKTVNDNEEDLDKSVGTDADEENNEETTTNEEVSYENEEKQSDETNSNEELVLSKDLEEKIDAAILADAKNSVNEAEEKSDDKESTEENATTSAKVAVITTKVDDSGNPLVGATLQILDMDGNVIDEWISDGTEHVSMIPEGKYILREKNAPDGYTTAADKEFTIAIEVNDVNADVEHDDSGEVCWHYGGVPLYFIECEGEQEEAYCVNQGWEEPNGVNYDGSILDETNIRNFTPDADTAMSDSELYHKVLDIIYHRSKAEELFPNLSEIEIRFITEYALKTYTSAEVTTRQAKRDEHGHIVRDSDGNIVYEDIRFLRYYSYDPNSPKGYVVDPENGNGIGKLAEHWYNQHGHSMIPSEYVDLFNYLINTDDAHPEDMILYIYSTSVMTEDGDKYQNLLGVKWFDNEEFKTYLTVVDKKKETPPPPPPHGNSPKTGDNSHLFEESLAMLGSSVCAISIVYYLSQDKKKNGKVKIKAK